MKILFASDLSLDYLERCQSEEEIKEMFRETTALMRKADHSVVNMENVFGCPEDYTPITKIGPNLICDREYVRYLDALKPDIVNFANNHVGDYGPELVRDTLEWMRSKGYQTMGAGNNIEEAYEAVHLEKDGVRVALIGVCENEFGVATETKPGSAGLNLGRLSNAILKAKEAGEMPIVYFHGGNEFNPFPTPGKVDLYRHLIDFGAKAIIAMHTHCPQAYEDYHGGVIVYSMGNFFFPAVNASYPPKFSKSWFYGYLSSLEIDHDGVSLEIIPYKFGTDTHELLAGEELEHFHRYMAVLNEGVQDKKKLWAYFDAWSVYRGLDYIKRANYRDTMPQEDPKQAIQLKSVFNVEAHCEMVANTANILFWDRLEEASREIPYVQKLQEMEY